MNQSPSKQHSVSTIQTNHVATVLLFPSFAYRLHDRTEWRIDIRGVAFKSKQIKLKRKLLLNVLRRFMDVPHSRFKNDLFEQRIAPFFCSPYKSKKVQLRIGERSIKLKRRTQRNGHFRARLKITEQEAQQLSHYFENSQFVAHASTSNGKSKTSLQPIRVIQPTGISVVSDIDDTIKESNVENRSELLANTFIRDFRSVPGMADAYRKLAGQGVEFHYVTTSPWQLFDPIDQMLRACGFPDGSLHLRTYRISDPLLKRLGVLHRGGKVGSIRNILTRFPGRKFILIGDSGERDLQIYSRFYRLRPDQVKHVLIRLVRPEHRYKESVIEAKMKLPRHVFQLFDSSNELLSIIENANVIQSN